MKALHLLFLFIFLTSCIQENKNMTGKTNLKPDSLKITDLQELAIVQTTNEISVVSPVIPGRTVTVGGNGADIQGFNSAAIQTAIDALRKTSNGGTIKLLPGTFDIIAPVRLYSNMTLIGSGFKTVLKKCAGFRSKFTLDADYGELQIKVADASGFREGMAVAVYDDDQRTGWALTTARITGIKENTIYIDDYLLRDYRSDRNGTISNACSVIEAVSAENIRIADLTVDGSGESNDMVDGCRAGGVYLHKVHNALVENVTVKDFNYDGISWQITEYVTVRNCEVFGCANSGLHPGTGSPFTLIEGNNCYNNGGYGLFVCWRVRNGIVRNNKFHDNGINGICTGHKDTDMLFADNNISGNGADGVHLRGETDLNAPHRNIFKNNLIENNGAKEKGYGFSVNCHAEGVVLEENTIRNTGTGKQVAAVLLTSNSLPVELKNNKISGHPEVEKEAK